MRKVNFREMGCGEYGLIDAKHAPLYKGELYVAVVSLFYRARYTQGHYKIAVGKIFLSSCELRSQWAGHLSNFDGEEISKSLASFHRQS